MRATPRKVVLGLLALGVIGAAVVSTGLTLPPPAPMTADGVPAELRVFHVEKRGLTISESEVAIFKNGQAFIRRDNRRLFEHRFRTSIAVAELPLAEVACVRTFLTGELAQHDGGPQHTLRPWNSEEWYFAVGNSRGWVAGPAGQIREVFQVIENLPEREQSTQIIEDSCLGFCYWPFGLKFAE